MSSIENMIVTWNPVKNVTRVEHSFAGIMYYAAKELGIKCKVVSREEVLFVDLSEFQLLITDVPTIDKLLPKNIKYLVPMLAYLKNSMYFHPGFGSKNLYIDFAPTVMNALSDFDQTILEWFMQSTDKLQTKRMQPEANIPKSDYVLLPMQYSQDVSIRHNDNDASYHNFVIEVASFCGEQNLTLVIKHHPDAYNHRKGESIWANNVVRECTQMCNVVVEDGNIRELIEHALVTANFCNEPTIIDAAVIGANIATSGFHGFCKTKAVVHDQSIKNALCRVVNSNKKCDRLEQLRLLWWVSEWIVYRKYDLVYSTRTCIDRAKSYLSWINEGCPPLNISFCKYYNKIKYEETGTDL